MTEHLTKRYQHSDEGEWRARIADRRVLVDGAPARPEQTLSSGQIVTWRRPPWREPPAPLEFTVLFIDDHLVVVDKPAGLPTLAGAGFLENTLQHVVSSRFPGASAAHRLGRWTSGLVAFGRTAEARTALAEAFRSGRVFKRYLALASGRPDFETAEIDTPIGPVSHDRLGTIHAATHDGRPARSTVRVLATMHDRFLVEVVIKTGRPHQIRIHLAAAGHPLVGDPLYPLGGRPQPGCESLPGDPGYLLHAAELRLGHPVTGLSLQLEAPPPSELAPATSPS